MGGVLSMTDEEKLRLNQLMIDLDEFEKEKKKPVAEEEVEMQTNDTIIAEYNPQAVKLAQGDGFLPDQSESNRLKQIDTILERKNSDRSGSSRNFLSSFVSKSKLSSSIFEVVAPQELLVTKMKRQIS
jgi:hypothetical protein